MKRRRIEHLAAHYERKRGGKKGPHHQVHMNILLRREEVQQKADRRIELRNIQKEKDLEDKKEFEKLTGVAPKKTEQKSKSKPTFFVEMSAKYSRRLLQNGGVKLFCGCTLKNVNRAQTMLHLSQCAFMHSEEYGNTASHLVPVHLFFLSPHVFKDIALYDGLLSHLKKAGDVTKQMDALRSLNKCPVNQYNDFLHQSSNSSFNPFVLGCTLGARSVVRSFRGTRIWKEFDGKYLGRNPLVRLLGSKMEEFTDHWEYVVMNFDFFELWSMVAVAWDLNLSRLFDEQMASDFDMRVLSEVSSMLFNNECVVYLNPATTVGRLRYKLKGETMNKLLGLKAHELRCVCPDNEQGRILRIQKENKMLTTVIERMCKRLRLKYEIKKYASFADRCNEIKRFAESLHEIPDTMS